MVRLSRGGTLPAANKSWPIVLISGSAASVWEDLPWMTPLKEFVQRCLNDAQPLLGVCFGHQLIAEVVAGPGAVVEAPDPEVGWIGVVSEPSSLFRGVEGSFEVFSSHKDAVVRTRGLEVLARSERCPVQAFQVTGAPAFGVQFHPEMGAAEISAVLRRRAVMHPALALDPEREFTRVRPRADIAAKLVSNVIGVSR